MSFSDLPNEVILLLIEAIVEPSELVTFAQLNRHVLRLCADRLKQHQALLKKYTKVRLGDGLLHPTVLLRDILNDPQIGLYYVKQVSFDCALYTSSSLHQPTYDRATKEAIEAVKHLLDGPKFDFLATYHRDWSLAIEKGDETHTFAALLLYLPQLQRLRLSGRGHDNDLYETIAKRSINHRDVLGQLHVVESGCEQEQDDDRRQCDWAGTSLVAVPSVKSLSFRRLFNDTPYIPDMRFQLECLEIASGKHNRIDFALMLKQMKGLKVLKYRITSGNLQASSVIKVLRETMTESLEVLSLTSSADVGTVESFKDFMVRFIVLLIQASLTCPW